MNVIVLGAPGTGKGTYSHRVSKHFNIPHISTGDLFRDHQKKETELGKKVQEFMAKGQLVPDEITIEMVKERLAENDCENGFILDGFPRTVAQAEALDKITNIDVAVYFSAEHHVIIDRITGRRICRDCGYIHHVKNIPMKKEGKCNECGGEVYQREDETPEVVKDRLFVYDTKTRPLINHYENIGILKEIDANLDINHPNFKVVDNFIKVLEELDK